MLRHLGPWKQTAHNALCGLAGAEVHAVHISGHLLKEILRGFDLRNRGLQGKVKEVTRGIGHNLFAKALQLLAVDKGERPQVRIDAAAAGVNIRQGHADQLDRFHLRSGIQRTARGITRRLPLPDLWLAGIGRKPELIEEVIHIAIHIGGGTK